MKECTWSFTRQAGPNAEGFWPFPCHDWHGGQGLREISCKLGDLLHAFSQVGVTPTACWTRPLIHTHTHKENVLLLPLPFFIHIGTTVRTSVKGTLPPPILPSLRQNSLHGDPCTRECYTRTTHGRSVSSRGGLDLRLLACFPGLPPCVA